MVEGVCAAILLVVVGMMLGIIEVPSKGAGATPEAPKAGRRRSGPSQGTQRAVERTKLRRLFPSRLV